MTQPGDNLQQSSKQKPNEVAAVTLSATTDQWQSQEDIAARRLKDELTALSDITDTLVKEIKDSQKGENANSEEAKRERQKLIGKIVAAIRTGALHEPNGSGRGDPTVALIFKIYDFAARGEAPATFYQGDMSSLPLRLEVNTADELADRLDKLQMVAFSNADATKEINRLLDHTSSKRIEEEMDTTTYHANAARLYDRIRTEFSEASVVSNTELNGPPVPPGGSKRPESREEKPGLTEKKDGEKPGRAVKKENEKPSTKSLLTLTSAFREEYKWTHGLGDEGIFKPLQERLRVAETFLKRYEQFLEHAKSKASSLNAYFGSDSSVEAYREATRPHARRIEKEGLFKSGLTVAMGLSSAAVVAIILALSSNLLLKNWLLAIVAGAGVIGYLASVGFGKTARANHMRDLRSTLLKQVRSEFGKLEPAHIEAKRKAAEAERAAEASRSKPSWLARLLFPTAASSKDANEARQAKGSGSRAKVATDEDEPFRFDKVKWDWFDPPIQAGSGTESGQSTQPSGDSKTQPEAPGNGAIAGSATSASDLIKASNKLWAKRSDLMVRSNERLLAGVAAICAIVVGTLAILDWLSGNTGPTIFLARSGTAGVCEIARGHPLLVANGSYFVLTGAHLNEVSKSSVLSVERASQKTEARECDNPPEPAGPTQVTFAPDDRAAFAGASSGHADKIAEALREIAEREPISFPPPCSQNCQASAATVFPVVVPVLVDTQVTVTGSKNDVDDDNDDGPIFITQIHVPDGPIAEFTSNNFVLLPLFPPPVSGLVDEALFGANGIDSKEEAFLFGLKKIEDPFLPELKTTLIGKIGLDLKACAERRRDDNASFQRLRLLVQGYASQKWDGAKGDATRKEFNWYLAEGRRLAVINALGLAGNELIEFVGPQPSTALGQLNDVGAVVAAEVQNGFLFDSHNEMQTSLDEWLKQAEGEIDSVNNAKREVIPRSVLISVEGDDLAKCRKEDQQAAAR